MFELLIQELESLEEVRAIALGGSRAAGTSDPESDYDLYIYSSVPVPEEKRLMILGCCCSKIEIANRFWETEDNVILKDGTPADLIYRSLPEFSQSLKNTLVFCQASNGYTTCLWHNLLESEILYDPYGELQALKKQYSIEYPPILRRNILRRNRDLLTAKLTNYRDQIAKAISRRDLVSMNHRSSVFMDSYFDILFALNFQPHPGEKRMISQALKLCAKLPDQFEERIQTYFQNLYADPEYALEILDLMIESLQEILPGDL